MIIFSGDKVRVNSEEGLSTVISVSTALPLAEANASLLLDDGRSVKARNVYHVIHSNLPQYRLVLGAIPRVMFASHTVDLLAYHNKVRWGDVIYFEDEIVYTHGHKWVEFINFVTGIEYTHLVSLREDVAEMKGLVRFEDARVGLTRDPDVVAILRLMGHEVLSPNSIGGSSRGKS